MTNKLRDSPGATCVVSNAILFFKPVCAILVVLLFVLMLFTPVKKNELTERQTSSQAFITQPSTHLRPSAAELVVITGGAGR